MNSGEALFFYPTHRFKESPACGLPACLPQADRGGQAGNDLYRVKVG